MSPNRQNEAEGYFLPAVAKTFAGSVFHPNDEVWEVWSATYALRFDFSSITGADKKLIQPAKTVLSWYVQHRSPGRAHNVLILTVPRCSEWVAWLSGESEVELSGEQIDHCLEISRRPVAARFGLGGLDQAVDALD